MSSTGLGHFGDAKPEVLELSQDEEMQRMLAAQDATGEFKYNSGKDFLVNLITPKTMITLIARS